MILSFSILSILNSVPNSGFRIPDFRFRVLDLFQTLVHARASLTSARASMDQRAKLKITPKEPVHSINFLMFITYYTILVIPCNINSVWGRIYDTIGGVAGVCWRCE